jgi:uncharacterized protein (TIGR03435 family)
LKTALFAQAALAALLASGASAQSEAVPEFEVASIKPAPPPAANMIMVRMRGGPGSDDPGRLDWQNVSLRNMLTNAFNLKEYQLQGPDWLNSERFDVSAKIPANTTREQFRLMLQKLLAERFKMTFHHETKEHAAYALTVAKGGPKLKESDPNDNSGFAAMPMPGRGGDIQMRAMAPPPPPPPGAARGGEGPKPGGPLPGRGGMMRMMPGHLEAKKMAVDGLVNTLSNLTGKPVVDETGLKGIYDFTLDFAPESAEGPMMMAPPPGGGGEVRMPSASEPASGATIYSAVQQQLGLKLESKKLPLDNVVIDRIEKIPTEN